MFSLRFHGKISAAIFVNAAVGLRESGEKK
jgi:hypothetical protein